MLIKRLLPFAVLFAIGACGTGPNAICTVDRTTERAEHRDELAGCTSDPGTQVVDIPLPAEDRSTVR